MSTQFKPSGEGVGGLQTMRRNAREQFEIQMVYVCLIKGYVVAMKARYRLFRQVQVVSVIGLYRLAMPGIARRIGRSFTRGTLARVGARFPKAPDNWRARRPAGRAVVENPLKLSEGVKPVSKVRPSSCYIVQYPP